MMSLAPTFSSLKPSLAMSALPQLTQNILEKRLLASEQKQHPQEKNKME